MKDFWIILDLTLEWTRIFFFYNSKTLFGKYIIDYESMIPSASSKCACRERLCLKYTYRD